MLKTNKLIQVVIILLLLITAMNQSSKSLAQTDESKVKAMWVYTLISYIKWNENPKGNQITLCTRGLDRTHHFLKKIQEEKDSSFKLKETSNHSNLRDCHLLYIATSEINNIESILREVSPLQIVTVSDIKGFAEDGGVIELVHAGSSVKLSINIKAAKNANVIINSDLLAVSNVINN